MSHPRQTACAIWLPKASFGKASGKLDMILDEVSVEVDSGAGNHDGLHQPKSDSGGDDGVAPASLQLYGARQS